MFMDFIGYPNPRTFDKVMNCFTLKCNKPIVHGITKQPSFDNPSTFTPIDKNDFTVLKNWATHCIELLSHRVMKYISLNTITWQ